MIINLILIAPVLISVTVDKSIKSKVKHTLLPDGFAVFLMFLLVVLSGFAGCDHTTNDKDASNNNNNCTTDCSASLTEGFGFQSFPMLQAYDQGTLDLQSLERISTLTKDVGGDMMRIVFNWQLIEPIEGEYNFSDYDLIIEELTDNGVTVLLEVSGSPQWAVPNAENATWTPPDDPATLAKFLVVSAERYKDKDVVWEIWNEPGNPPYWGMEQSTPQDYLDLLELAYFAIKSADSNASVVCGALLIEFMHMKEPDYSYLDGLLELDVLNFCDAFSVHIYPKETPEAPENFDVVFNTVKAKIQSFGDVPIWLTEVGLNSKRFSVDALIELLLARGLTQQQIQEMNNQPACKLGFFPVIVMADLVLKEENRDEIGVCLEPYGISVDDAFYLSEEAFLDVQEEQADFVEHMYELSKSHRVFWFQLADVARFDGVLFDDFEPKLSYERLLDIHTH